MAALALVKHSMPEIRPTVPANRWRLSSIGKTRCKWLADELAGFNPENLYASVEPKARDTAELVGLELGLDSQTVDGLHESDRSGFPYFRDKVQFERRIRAFFDSPDVRLIGNETANEALDRFRKAIVSIAGTCTDKTTCVVAHGTVISLFVSNYNNVSAFEIWSALSPLPAYIVLDDRDYQITHPAVGYPDAD